MQKSNQQKMFESINHWQQSGLSQKAWCENHNITYSTFHYWYKRYRNQHGDISPKDPAEGFVQLLVGDDPGSGWCELVWGEGRKLVFHQPVSAEFLKALMD